ncbi:MAG: tRNA (N6-isopentenyl adenosine(37)-C2)-methylthiotransferase MiaB [Chloroflexota bacterium]
MRYHIWTVGCQMNKADSGRIATSLDALGLRGTSDVAGADVIVVNSCSVRESAEQRVLGKLGSLKRLKQRRPHLLVVLTGCMVGEDNQAIRRRLPMVDAFLGPSDVDGVVEAIKSRFALGTEDSGLDTDVATARCGAAANSDGGSCRHKLESSPVTAWVPIIYGCNNFCSYCIVPYRRGRERSRPPDEVVREVESLVASGTREVTLLGQNVDSYGRDLPGRPDLADLLGYLQEVEGLYRIRFLTSHPKDMTDKLIQAVGSLSKVCEHINLPVQHGDDQVLRSMRRGYTSQQYRELVGRLRSIVPHVSLSTDIIVGYPGETREQFQHTYDLLAEIGFDVVHAAMYSPRPGTRAASLPDDVPPEEKKRRLVAIEQLQESIVADANRRLIGQTVEVLFEELHKGKWQGRTRTNKLVFVRSDRDLRGRLVDVEVESSTAWSLQAKLADSGLLMASR